MHKHTCELRQLLQLRRKGSRAQAAEVQQPCLTPCPLLVCKQVEGCTR